jgi:hypothetical protein
LARTVPPFIISGADVVLIDMTQYTLSLAGPIEFNPNVTMFPPTPAFTPSAVNDPDCPPYWSEHDQDT